jgi:ElaB/YqjD/DUF883 family membrane-anchored ribosome-binding protein
MTADQGGSTGTAPATKQELEAEIEELRDDLGDTVEALSRRLDVKARVKDRLRRTSPAVPVAAAAVVGVTVALLVWRRRS